jgi:photosystem II stability/assembly factor-like uncharacterized protein
MSKLAVMLAPVMITALILSAAGCGEDGEPSPPPTATSGPGEDVSILWESMGGPPGGHFSHLMLNPYDHDELYTLSVHGAYKSEDKGESWRLLPLPEGGWVGSMAVHEGRLFLGGGTGAFYYDDAGKPVRVEGAPGGDVIISDDKLFVLTGSEEDVYPRLFCTNLTSDGYNWRDISPTKSELGDLAVPSEDAGLQHGIRIGHLVALGDRILASIIVEVEGSGDLSNGGLYISEDRGGTWARVDLDVREDLVVSNIVQDHGDPQHVLLLFRHPVLHDVTYPVHEFLQESRDGGQTWSKATALTLESNGLTDAAILGTAYYLPSPASGYILKIDGPDHELLEMPTVKEFEGITFGLETLLFDLDDPTIVYGRTGSAWSLGLVKSEDGMKTWQKMDGDIVASSPTIVLAHPTHTETIFTSGNVIQESYCTRDAGESWQPFSPTFSGDEVRIDPHDPDHLLLVDEMTTLYESYDSGRIFQRAAEEFTGAKVLDIEVAPGSPDKIYASNLGVGISQRSGDEEWQYMTGSPDYSYAIELDPDDASVLYATYSPKLFESHSSVWKYSESANSGWAEILRIEESAGTTALEIDKTQTQNMYAGAVGERGEIYHSADKGETWNRLNDDFTFVTIHEMAIDPTDEDTVYAAPWGGGLYLSEDSGASWAEMEAPTISVSSIVIDPDDSNHLIIGDRTGPNVYESLDRGQTWSDLVVLPDSQY